MLLKMSRRNGKHVFVEVDDRTVPALSGSGTQKASAVGKALTSVDEIFDRVVQNEIVENCNMLAGAFGELRSQITPPNKAAVEFGLEFSGEGNIYLVKSAATASIKVSVEWSLNAQPKTRSPSESAHSLPAEQGEIGGPEEEIERRES